MKMFVVKADFVRAWRVTALCWKTVEIHSTDLEYQSWNHSPLGVVPLGSAHPGQPDMVTLTLFTLVHTHWRWWWGWGRGGPMKAHKMMAQRLNLACSVIWPTQETKSSWYFKIWQILSKNPGNGESREIGPSLPNYNTGAVLHVSPISLNFRHTILSPKPRASVNGCSKMEISRSC